MKRFMFILFENENTYTDFSPEDMQKEFDVHMKWIEELGEHYDSGEPLEQPAKTVKGKDAVVTDGPYIESKELVTGYYLIKASSLEEATELAKGCPVLQLGGSIEVREIMETDM
ncbi:YciI family protein [Rhodohalobacter sp. 614A]|uniref:YciI family protein n=1 Tax=Rhodohalobacter sp. 614A TaxID=2908649 RepID=UPI001F43E9E2|nr:YciI family protein [Rhodohalobacter sp. 614A]